MSKGKPEAKGLIYFMRRADGVGPIKIGCSKWPERRLAMFQVWSPEPLEIVAAAPGRFADERRIHRQFEAYRLHSEWFEAAPPVLSMLAKVAATGVLPPAPASDRSARIRAMYAAGETLERIAAEMGVSRQRIEQIARKEGLAPRGRRSIRKAPVWSRLEEVRSLAANGCSRSEIADAIGDTAQNVSNACRIEGIPLKRAKKTHSDATASVAFEVASLYKTGETTQKIAERFGMPQPNIYRLLRIAGVKPNRISRPCALPVSEIVAAYRAGGTLTDLALKHGCKPHAIRSALVKACVTLRTRAENEALRIAKVSAANRRRQAA